jgi:diguanylate cyclase (GGDEF)-like protein
MRGTLIQLHTELQPKNTAREEAARTDSLTGLRNFQAVQDWAMQFLKSATLHSFPMWVILADLDSFHVINEIFGHDAGDTVLTEVAYVMKANSRPSDVWGRAGDDEFISVLTGVSEEHIEALLERYRFQVAMHEFSFGEHSVTVTASFGVATFSGIEAPDFTHLVSDAGKALFEAKQAGGNRIKIAGWVSWPGDLEPDSRAPSSI